MVEVSDNNPVKSDNHGLGQKSWLVKFSKGQYELKVIFPFSLT